MAKCASGEKLSSRCLRAVATAAFPDSCGARTGRDRSSAAKRANNASCASSRFASSACSSSSTNVPTPSTSSSAPSTSLVAARQAETIAAVLRTTATGVKPSAASSSANCEPSASLGSSGSSSSRRVLVVVSSFGPFVRDEALVADRANPQRFVRLRKVAARVGEVLVRLARPADRSRRRAPPAAPRAPRRRRPDAFVRLRIACDSPRSTKNTRITEEDALRVLCVFVVNS